MHGPPPSLSVPAARKPAVTNDHDAIRSRIPRRAWPAAAAIGAHDLVGAVERRRSPMGGSRKSVAPVSLRVSRFRHRFPRAIASYRRESRELGGRTARVRNTASFAAHPARPGTSRRRYTASAATISEVARISAKYGASGCAAAATVSGTSARQTARSQLTHRYRRQSCCRRPRASIDARYRPRYWPRASHELLQGSWIPHSANASAQPLHGVGIADRIEQVTHGVFAVGSGSLFPALNAWRKRDGSPANGANWRMGACEGVTR